LSVISMQSGGALHVFDIDPQRAREALSAIRATSREALRDLRGTLDTLRLASGPRSAPDLEIASLDRLPELVTRMAQGGIVVEMRCDGDPRPLPCPVDAAAYRIVQESLTNVLRHAGTDNAAVRVEYRPEAVVVEVTDDGCGAPGPEGHGIVGMRERAATVGGTLTLGPRPEGGFAVRALLPTGTGAALVAEEAS
jgi:signal transduction histidine kinase